MYLLPTLLALSLYASEATAQALRPTKCRLDKATDGTIWSNYWHCDLKPHNLYACRAGTSVVHKQSIINIHGGDADSTILIACNNKGWFIHCPPHELGSFRIIECKGPVESVSNVQLL
ncbi:putative amidase [Venturia inaequalis]|nr:putative amidase [Venturia inaequalis]